MRGPLKKHRAVGDKAGLASFRLRPGITVVAQVGMDGDGDVLRVAPARPHVVAALIPGDDKGQLARGIGGGDVVGIEEERPHGPLAGVIEAQVGTFGGFGETADVPVIPPEKVGVDRQQERSQG